MDIEKKIDLNGKWKYKEDRSGYLNYSQALISFNYDININEIPIPSNYEKEGLHNYNGVLWLYYQFNIDKLDNTLPVAELVFHGADYFVEVWLNDTLLGNHEGYFQKFSFVCSDLLKLGSNFILVRLNSPYEEPVTVWPLKKTLIKGIFGHHDCRPGACTNEHGQDGNTGGIWNNVEIIFSKANRITEVHVRNKIYHAKNLARAIVSVDISSTKAKSDVESIQITIISPSNKTYLNRSSVTILPGNNSFVFHIDIDSPKLWYPYDIGVPALYEIEVTGSSINSWNGRFGIREVYLDDQSAFHINGKRLFLRGTNVIPEQYLSILTRNKIEQQVKMAKEAGINIIRMHAHVNRTEYYEICDEQGMMIWQDFPLQWTYSESAEFARNAVSQIKDMVNQLFNHPSIVFWCCHNEPKDQINNLDAKLEEAIKDLDNTRIVRRASNYEEHAYDGWYWGNKEHFAAAPMGPLVTEFGAQGIPDKESLLKFMPKESVEKPDWDLWEFHDFQYKQTFHVAEVDYGNSVDDFIVHSQNYQADLIKTAIDFYRRKKNSGITGIFQFMLIDCWPSITWSVIDYYYKPKLGYFALKQVFQPLYPSIKLRQRKYYAGKKLQIDVWVINDLNIKFNNLELNFYIDNENIGSIKHLSIAEDAIYFIDYENIFITLPVNLKTGKHKVVAFLIDLETQLNVATNDFEIEIVETISFT